MEGFFATGSASPRETTRSEREERAESSTATHGAPKPIAISTVPMPLAVPKAVVGVLVYLVSYILDI